MHKMLKHLKKYTGMIVLIVGLLVCQAVCELWLPTYTASIVDVGLQQKGVEDGTPILIREETLQSLLIWMSESDANTLIEPNYHVATQEEITSAGATETTSTLLVLGEVDSDTQALLENAFSYAWLLQSAITADASASGMELSGLIPDMNGQDISPEIFVSMMQSMSADQRDPILSEIYQSLEAYFPSTLLTQAAVTAVSAEYEAIGINLDDWQSAAIFSDGAMMLLIALLSALASITVGYFGSIVAASLGRDLRSKVFHRVIAFGQAEMDQYSTASLITRTTNDIQQIQTVMVMLLRMVIYAPIIGIGGFIRAWQTNPSMSWVIGVGVLAVMSIVGVLMIFALPRFKRIQKQIDHVNRVMRETLTGLPVIRAFCTQKREEERFDEASVALTKTQLFVNRLMSGMMPMMMLVMNGISLLVLWVGASGIDAGTMQVGTIMAYIQYAMQIIMAFLMISMMSIMLPRASVSASRVQEVLDTSIAIDDPKAPKALDSNHPKRGTVVFDHVSFRYPNADENALTDLSFTANPGETTAILGGTGCGKSTLLNLIPRFYDASEGTITIGGENILEIGLNDLRDHIGFVPQKAVLFSGTVASNIGFGENDIPLDQIKTAAKVAQATDFIDSRNGAYDSAISQGGTNVSGGQKQRLSIARAVAKKPDIFLFDDSFSALDFKTDAAVRSALKEYAKDATTIVVAQRIATVMQAEQIIVLDDGIIVGKGTHQDLMQNCEVYRQIATSQLSKEELANG